MFNLSITNECNRRCSYCFQSSWYLASDKDSIREMSLDNVEHILKMMYNIDHFQIMGGEPLLHSNILGILELIRSYGKTVTMVSNITVSTELLHTILRYYSDVITSWLINVDYPDTQKILFLRNYELFSNVGGVTLSTTLVPNGVTQSIERVKQVLNTLPAASPYIRISPYAPNHRDYKVYDFTMDIYIFITAIWEKRKYFIIFDCSLNACEVHPLLMHIFKEDNYYIKWNTQICGGWGALDIMVDGSVIYCSSAPFIKLNSIFEYDSIYTARLMMFYQWNDFVKNNPLKCGTTTCDKYSLGYCNGLCIAKNYALHHKV